MGAPGPQARDRAEPEAALLERKQQPVPPGEPLRGEGPGRGAGARPHFLPTQGKSWAQLIPPEKGKGGRHERAGPAHKMGFLTPPVRAMTTETGASATECDHSRQSYAFPTKS